MTDIETTTSENVRYWFQHDVELRCSMVGKYGNVPISALSFSPRTTNALLRHDIVMSVADLFCIGSEVLHIRGIGQKSLNEINEKLFPLLSGKDISIDTNYQNYGKQQEHNTQLPALPDGIAKQPIKMLTISKRVIRALDQVGIETIGDIEQASSDELAAIPSISSKGVTEIHKGIYALTSAYNAEKQQIDWDQFWESQGFVLLPKSWEDKADKVSVWSNFSLIIRDICLLSFDERSWIIIRRRFGIDGRQVLTLEELATAFNLTRERVRQVEKKQIRLLQLLFLENDYGGLNFRLRFEVSNIISSCLSIIIDSSRLGIQKSELRHLMIENCKISHEELDRVFELFLAICNIRTLRIRTVGLEPILIHSESLLPKRTDLIIQITHRFLTSQATSASDVDILIGVNKKLNKKDRINLKTLRQILPLCSSIEQTANGSWQGRFNYLSNRMVQVERILLESGEPMLISEIAREINTRIINDKRKLIDERNLVNQMIRDERFAPIGRSGFWALKRWSIETGTIIEMMKQFLSIKNAPATVEDITNYVQGKRPASQASISSYLFFSPEFSQIDGKTWGLSSWNEARENRWGVAEVAKFVEFFFRQRNVERIDYRELKHALKEKTGFSDRRVRGLLNANPAILTEKVNSTKRVAVFQPDYEDALMGKKSRRRHKKTIFEELSDDVRNILESEPGKQIGLKKLIDQLTKKYGYRYKRPYHSLHSFISRMNFVEKVRIANSNLVICRLKNAVFGGLREKALQIQTPQLRENVIRTLSFLTEDDVDVALFLLSKEFENTLQKYIDRAIQKGQLNKPPKKRLTLQDMIVIVKKEQIITDDTVLSFLRQARNLRAHGSMPSREERKIMLSQADVTAGMYIDYIQMFDSLFCGLE